MMSYAAYQERQDALFFESQPHCPGREAEEEARMFGYERPNDAWLLTPYDTWVSNPYYQGPPQPHPEAWDPITELEYDIKALDFYGAPARQIMEAVNAYEAALAKL